MHPVSGKIGYGTHILLAAALLQGFALAGMRLVCIPKGVSCTCFRCVSCAFQTHADVTLELSCTVVWSMFCTLSECVCEISFRLLTLPPLLCSDKTKLVIPGFTDWDLWDFNLQIAI